jgi:hypothetical protein
MVDGCGNFSPRMAAQNGQLLKLVSIGVCVFKDGRIVGIKTTVTPCQKVAFA